MIVIKLVVFINTKRILLAEKFNEEKSVPLSLEMLTQLVFSSSFSVSSQFTARDSESAPMTHGIKYHSVSLALPRKTNLPFITIFPINIALCHPKF